jgi:hypothetical protein
VAAPATTLTGNGKTDAFDLRPAVSDRVFAIFTGGTGGTITPQYSNKEGTKVDADWTPDINTIAVSANAGPYGWKFGIAKFIRFVGNGVTGTVSVRWGAAKNGRGEVIDINTETIPPVPVTA